MDARRRAGKGRCDQAARLTERTAVLLLKMARVVDEHGNNVVATDLQPGGIDGELPCSAGVVAKEMPIEPGRENAVVAQVHTRVGRENNPHLLTRGLEVAAIPYVAVVVAVAVAIEDGELVFPVGIG